MADVLFVLVTLAVFAVLLTFVAGCERLIRRQG
jgi:hypothetical protein